MIRVELEDVSRDGVRVFVVLVRDVSPRRDDAPRIPSLASAPAPTLREELALRDELPPRDPPVPLALRSPPDPPERPDADRLEPP